MTRMTYRSALGVLALTAVAGWAPALASGPESLDSYVQPGLQEIRATLVVEQKNDAALKEIGKDAEQGYRIRRTTFSLKEPDKVRVEGKYGLVSVLYVINGDRKLRSAMGVRKVKNIAQRPGERYTVMELGAVTPSLVERLESRFLRWETRGGKRMPVFEVRLKGEPGGARPEHLVIDPTTRTIVERSVLFRTRPQVRERYVYHNPTRYANDVWLPTRVELYSNTGKLAVSSRYEEVTVNGGLSDRLFQF